MFCLWKKGRLASNCFHGKAAGMTDSEGSGYRRNDIKSLLTE